MLRVKSSNYNLIRFELLALSHKLPPVFPSKGRLVVDGYVLTEKFTVLLNPIDAVDEVE